MTLQRKTRHPFGIAVDDLTTEDFLQIVINRAHQKGLPPFFITYLNAHCINRYFKDDAYSGIIDGADLIYADGQAVVWASRFLGEGLPERVNAGDFFLEFCRRCARENLSLYLLGSYKQVAQKAGNKIRKKVPGLEIKGVHHGFFPPEDIQRIRAEIAGAKPSILLVGMGVPRQEKFALEHLRDLPIPVIWCVGALSEYFAEKIPRAPVWMRRAGLEWLFRLAMEPRRLWKRYLLGNLRFILRTFQYKWKKRNG